MTPNDCALHLASLGIDWNIQYSTYTGQWYVSAPRLNLSNGSTISGVSVHRDTPDGAVVDFVREIRDEGQLSQVIAVDGPNARRYYRWNGVCFAEVPNHLLPWAG